MRLDDRQRGTRTDRGYTLVELMIVLTVLSVVLTAVYYSFFRTQASARRTERIVEARQSSRAALQLIERELRMVGSGWGRIPVYGSLNGAPLTLLAVSPGYAVAGDDSIALLGAWDTSTTLRAPLPATDSAIPCVSAQGFKTGDFVLVTNGSAAHIFQVTGIVWLSEDLLHDATSIYNLPGGHINWPAGGYGVGSRVYRIAWVTYRVDKTMLRKPCLVRSDRGFAPQVVATDVSAFHVWYRLQDDTITRDPANLSLIEKIRPVIETQVAERGSVVLTDSVWTMVRPRAF